MVLAPIVLFVYNRPWHTEQTLNALAENELADQSTLFIYADGPRSNASAEILKKIKETREIIRKKKWCKEVHIIESETNQGLADAVINGVTRVIDEYEKVIVLEDDLVTSRYFLRFMNDGLDLYSDEQKVISIGALNFFATDDQVPETFFIPIPDCWGWATWQNRWQLFESNPQKLLNQLREKELIDSFNLYGAYDFEAMLIDQIKGNVSSWAIRWQAVAYLENKLALYPKYSVTKNIGFDAQGTHGGEDKYSNLILFADHPIKIKKLPVLEDPAITKKMIAGYSSVTQISGKSKMKAIIKRGIKNILPPAMASIYRRFRQIDTHPAVWQGRYPTWESATEVTGGYNASNILEITRKATLKVKNGEAAGERDSVLFEDIPYVWPVTAHLLKIIIENNGKLNIIDFGGSLGSSYFQNKNMIPPNTKLSWNIVEQENYVRIGNEEISDEKLHFFYTIDEAYTQTNADTLLLSSVLQYLENPYDFFDKIISYGFENIIIDRTAFINGSEDMITVQTVPDSIYKASYPAWFFGNDRFKNYIKASYKILYEFDSEVDTPISLNNEAPAYWKGYILKKKN